MRYVIKLIHGIHLLRMRVAENVELYSNGATPNSQPSWSKGLKRSGLYYEGIVDDCHRLWGSIAEALCPPLVPELHTELNLKDLVKRTRRTRTVR